MQNDLRLRKIVRHIGYDMWQQPTNIYAKHRRVHSTRHVRSRCWHECVKRTFINFNSCGCRSCCCHFYFTDFRESVNLLLIQTSCVCFLFEITWLFTQSKFSGCELCIADLVVLSQLFEPAFKNLWGTSLENLWTEVHIFFYVIQFSWFKIKCANISSKICKRVRFIFCRYRADNLNSLSFQNHFVNNFFKVFCEYFVNLDESF